MEAAGRVFRSLARLEPLPMTPPEAVLHLFLIKCTAGGRTPASEGSSGRRRPGPCSGPSKWVCPGDPGALCTSERRTSGSALFARVKWGEEAENGRGRASSQAHQAGQLHPRCEGSSWEPPAPACFFSDRLNTALGDLGPGSSLSQGRLGRRGPLESQQRLPPAYKGRDGHSAPAEAWMPQLGPPCLPRSLKPSRW